MFELPDLTKIYISEILHTTHGFIGRDLLLFGSNQESFTLYLIVQTIKQCISYSDHCLGTVKIISLAPFDTRWKPILLPVPFNPILTFWTTVLFIYTIQSLFLSYKYILLPQLLGGQGLIYDQHYLPVVKSLNLLFNAQVQSTVFSVTYLSL